MTKVLGGYRVVEHGQFITGPYTALLLADMGADVVKVEAPGAGDPFRSFEQGTYGPQFQAFNRNKKSIQLDLDVEADREVMRQLLCGADVYIQNFRPGAAERKGFGPAEARALNPRLVYCAITGFGRDGPLRIDPPTTR
jgi:crotonobetainyl-CoA:carnitine CoA-transferase CaiB-like acyl-CoA transferase